MYFLKWPRSCGLNSSVGKGSVAKKSIPEPCSRGYNIAQKLERELQSSDFGCTFNTNASIE